MNWIGLRLFNTFILKLLLRSDLGWVSTNYWSLKLVVFHAHS
jgi:hypothetical protein